MEKKEASAVAFSGSIFRVYDIKQKNGKEKSNSLTDTLLSGEYVQFLCKCGKVEKSLDRFYLGNKNTEQFSASGSVGVFRVCEFRGLP